ncbi:diacylglycerol/polyprenol kinase family protein [Anaerosalibacter sp. Marseille-P3206]|uniref:diacylglycerol/polyprenol kinase family protein n=1 Tax=Anaerosalibacter sp. Marseille-P3206 TaxID=1871005 RepID=UPI000986E230|nr:hypothetical protein [Anaerosalibacter sp. Marseille-P3206]
MAIGIIVSFVYIFLIIAVATILNKRDLISNEGSRKFIHIMLSNWWFIAMHYFKTPMSASIVPAIFVLINYLSYKNNIFKAMEREEEEETLGTVYYAVSLLILSLISFSEKLSPWIGAAGILVMGYGDGFAAIIGSKYGKHRLNFGSIKKSVEGSLAMFVFSFICLFAITFYTNSLHSFGYVILIAVVATIVELFSPKGTDNLAVPLVVSLLYYLLVF